MKTPVWQAHTSVTGLSALWVGAVLSASVGFLFYTATRSTIESDAYDRFQNMAAIVQNSVNSRIKTYTDVLIGSASLFRTSENLTRAQFHNYVNGLNLANEFPGIETINFARHITDEERPAFEKFQRADLALVASGYPPFKIKPPGRRSEYTVVTFIEPIAAWSNKFGVDLQARPAVATSLAISRDTGLPASSGTPVPLNSTTTGIGMRIPIYRTGMPAGTAADRRAAYVGSVGIGFSVQVLVQGVIEQMPVRGVRLRLLDIDAPVVKSHARAKPILLFDSIGAKAIPTRGERISADAFYVILPIRFTDRQWEAQFSILKKDLYSTFDFYVPWLAFLAGTISTALLYALYHTLVSSRKRALALAENMTRELRASEAKLQVTNENLRRLAAHAENIKESERKRIAREIHDELGQNLLALRMDADRLAARSGDRHPLLHARARATLQQIDLTIKSVRQIINDLRPNVLDLGLTAAVEWLVGQFRERTGIDCELVEGSHELEAAGGGATALFRILQESLTNISRHARATRVCIELREEGGSITMKVSDNGIGMGARSHDKAGSFGLVGIEERVKILGGSFQIDDRPGGGTVVAVSIPARINIVVPSPIVAPSPAEISAYAEF